LLDTARVASSTRKRRSQPEGRDLSLPVQRANCRGGHERTRRGAGAGGRASFAPRSGRASLAATGPAPTRATSERKGLMPSGISRSDSMFSIREMAWHGLGAVLDRPPATMVQALGARDSASASSVSDRGRPRRWRDRPRLVGGRCEEFPGYYAPVHQGTRTALGIVVERYRIAQSTRRYDQRHRFGAEDQQHE
jgi:hypothetical protein